MFVRSVISCTFFAFCLLFLAPWAEAAEVVLLGDTQLKPVLEIISGIKKTLNASLKIYPPQEVKGRLKNIIDREEARVVIALGRDALNEALQLPSSIPVIYDLVVTPPAISRHNTAGYYMATPVKAYADLFRGQLKAVDRVAVVGSREYLNLLAGDNSSAFVHYPVATPYELVNVIRRIENVDAIMLLPDATLLTATALEEAYLVSFRKGIPLLGISEKNVKQGALLALVVDMVNVGRTIGEHAARALHSGNLGQPSSAPPRRFDLYVNTDTARKMGIRLPDELFRIAKRAFP